MTAQKESEVAIHALNSELSRFQMMVQTIDEYAIYSMDAHGMITSWGVGAEKISGWTSERMVGYHPAGWAGRDDVASGCRTVSWQEAAHY